MLSEERIERAEAHAEQILDGFLPVHEVCVFDLAGMVQKTVATIRELQARVAELEADARMGRLVNEILISGRKLCHWDGDDWTVYRQGLPRATELGQGKTALEALEAAAQKEETRLKAIDDAECAYHAQTGL